MTHPKQPKAKAAVRTPGQAGELSDAALNQVAGAMLACMPTGQTAAQGSGVGAGAVLADPPGEITVRPQKGS